MPRLRHVSNPRLANVTDQHEGQTVLVRAAELINARTSASFRDRSGPAGLLSCDGIACDSIGAPDLCLWVSSHDVKCTVGINCPDSAERVGPCASERGWTRRCHGRAGTHQRDQGACENDSERVL